MVYPRLGGFNFQTYHVLTSHCPDNHPLTGFDYPTIVP